MRAFIFVISTLSVLISSEDVIETGEETQKIIKEKIERYIEAAEPKDTIVKVDYIKPPLKVTDSKNDIRYGALYYAGYYRKKNGGNYTLVELQVCVTTLAPWQGDTTDLLFTLSGSPHCQDLIPLEFNNTLPS